MKFEILYGKLLNFKLLSPTISKCVTGILFFKIWRKVKRTIVWIETLKSDRIDKLKEISYN